MPGKAAAARRPYELGLVREYLAHVEKSLRVGDVAMAAGYAYSMSRSAASVADTLRFEQGVSAGLARAKHGPRKGRR